ncbi:hypothetical protein CcCBS67573_g09266, partial [Chytriomyces confervae]
MAGTTAEMSLLSLIPQHVRDLILDTESVREPPWADVSEFGLTAIIDISGYSKITSQLKAHYGNDGGAKAKELLNPPIIEIIKRVQNGYGSVVKFAGDAIIASWSSKAPLSDPEKEFLTLKAMLCCLELLSFFSDYHIMIPTVSKDAAASTSPTSTIPLATTTQSPLNPANIIRTSTVHVSGKRSSVASNFPTGGTSRKASASINQPALSSNLTPSASPLPPVRLRQQSANPGNLQLPNRNSLLSQTVASRRQSLSPTEVSTSIDGGLDIAWKPHALKIHIGLGFGCTSHIHVGSGYDVKEMGSESRVEYFIAGDSMKSAAEYLALGVEGDVVFSPEIVSILTGHVQTQLQNHSELKKSVGRKYRIMSSSSDDTFEMVIPLNEKLAHLQLLLEKKSIPVIRSVANIAMPDEDQSKIAARAVAFMDDGIKRLLENTLIERKRPESATISSISTPPMNRMSFVNNISSIFDNYDQLRNVATLFLKMPTFKPETLHEPDSLNVLQQVMQIVLNTISKFEGCLRQFNCDDKGVTALLVWGLDGFSHEKGESSLVIGASLHMLGPLKKMFGDRFSIGVATGSVFSGIVGNTKRCDGTILGVSVNNAARFMCLPQCEGGILCDEETYSGSNDTYTYKADLPPVVIKGVAEPVKIYSPSKKSRLGSAKLVDDEFSLVGRDLEKMRLQSIIGSWKADNSESILIVGRSGVGKSQLKRFCEAQLSNDRRIMLCSSQSLEHQQKAPLYIFGEILRELSHHIKQRVDMKDITPSGSQRTSRLSYSAASRSNRSSVKPADFDRRRSVALSILESALSSRRPSVTLPVMLQATDNTATPMISLGNTVKPEPTTERPSSRRSSLVDGMRNLLIRRSTGEATHGSGNKLSDGDIRPKTETSTRKSSMIPPIGNLNRDPSFKRDGSFRKAGVMRKMNSSSSKFLDAPFPGIIGARSQDSNLKSTMSTFLDHGAIVQYLHHLGEPQSSIDSLRFIPGIMEGSDTTQMSSEIIPRLAGIFSKLFESLTMIGFRVALIFDDLQWCDSHSYDLLSSILKMCPQVLCIMVSRPVEEWSKLHVDRFRTISSLCKHDLSVAPFQQDAIQELLALKFRSVLKGTDKISSHLVNDVLERSQGIPLVANIFINMLHEESLLKVENGVLSYSDESTLFQLPSEAVGAVVSQFDKLPKSIKIILKLSAVSGQHFDLTEISSIVLSSPSLQERLATIDCSPTSLYNQIISADKYRFIKKGENVNCLAFSHYLIQQGILSTVIPSKREEMHGLFAQYYEEKLKNEGTDRRPYFTQLFIYHLMQLNGQFEKKQRLLYQAFIESVNMFRSSEALEYYQLLSSVRREGRLQCTALEMAKESRLLGCLYFHSGDRQVALNHYYHSLSMMGLKLPKYNIARTIQAALYIQMIKRFIKQPSSAQYRTSTQMLHKKFPACRHLMVSKAESFSSAGDRYAQDSAVEEVSAAISGILRILGSRSQTADFYVLNSLATLIMGCDEDQTLRYCFNFLQTAETAMSLGFKSLSRELTKKSDLLYQKVLQEYRIESMSSVQTDLYVELIREKAARAREVGAWKEALEQFQELESIRISIGLGASEDAFWCRSKIAELMIILGDFSGAEYDREQNMKWYMGNMCDVQVTASYMMQQAVVQCCQGNVEEASKVYLQNAETQSTTQTGTDIDADYRAEQGLVFEACCLRVTTCIMQYAVKKDDVASWKTRSEKHCRIILSLLCKQDASFVCISFMDFNISRQSAVLWIVIDAISDWYIKEDGMGRRDSTKEVEATADQLLLRFCISIKTAEAPDVLHHLMSMSKSLVTLRKGQRTKYCKEIDWMLEQSKEKEFMAEFHKVLLLTFRWMVSCNFDDTQDSRDADAQAYTSYFESMDFKFRCDVIERRLLKKLQISIQRSGHESMGKKKTAAVTVAAAPVDFPRGGSQSQTLTSLELRDVNEKAAKDLFANDDSEESPSKKHKKRPAKEDGKDAKKRKKNADSDLSESGTGDKSKAEKSDTIAALTFKKLNPGFTLLGVIKEINDLELIVSLPNQMTGAVSITEISQEITDLVERVAANEDGDDEAEQESSLPSLNHLFKIGQSLPVLAITTEKAQDQAAKRKIELSIKPERINSTINVDEIRAGMTLSASVKSHEDNGYILSFGFKDSATHGFLHKKHAAAFIKSFDSAEKTTLAVGQVFYVSVLSIDDSKRTVGVTADPEAIAKSIVPTSHNLSFASLKPGLLIPSRVKTTVDGSGIIVSFMGLFEGNIELGHLGEKAGDGMDLAKNFKAGMKVQPRILYVDTLRKKVGFTLLNSLISWTTEKSTAQLRSIEIGT